MSAGHVGARGLQVGMTVFIYLLCMLPCMQDPNGAYIARWVPELAALPKKWLHQPWLAPADVLAHAGVKIGDGPGCYPPRITTAVLQVRITCLAHALQMPISSQRFADSCGRRGPSMQ